MSGPRSQIEGDDDVLMLLDISRAHLHSPLARAVFVTVGGDDAFMECGSVNSRNEVPGEQTRRREVS